MMPYRYGDSMTEQELIEVMLEDRIAKFFAVAAQASYMMSRVIKLNRIIFALEQINAK